MHDLRAGSSGRSWCLFSVFVLLAVSSADGVQLVRPAGQSGTPLFVEDFEGDLSRWRLYGDEAVSRRLLPDLSHRGVLVLAPNGDVHALITGSEAWPSIRFEGDFRFPSDTGTYLGVVYNFQQHGGRTDFGVIYIKSDGSYLQVNPHRDYNVSRTIYPEYHVPLTGAAAVRIGEWHRFRIEIIGRTCHFYVGDITMPSLTFSLYEGESGSIGLQPRSVGGAVEVDNIAVTSIARFSYDGEARPGNMTYSPDSLLTQWEAVGPLPHTDDRISRSPGTGGYPWRGFSTDERGALITGRLVDFHGPRTVAYFRTRVEAAEDADMTLHLSSVDDLAIWINGRFHWFVPRSDAAWFDFWQNPEHRGTRIPVNLKKGENDIVVRVRGGVYASGGFYARLEE
jgi:hypothetical protein